MILLLKTRRTFFGCLYVIYMFMGVSLALLLQNKIDDLCKLFEVYRYIKQNRYPRHVRNNKRPIEWTWAINYSAIAYNDFAATTIHSLH